MKVIIINSVGISFDENSLNKSGLGGSETWAVQLSNAFKERNIDVTVMCSCNAHVANNGVQYASFSEFNNIMKTQKFDLCIISRFYSDLIGVIDECKACDNVWIQAHDPIIFGDTFDSIKCLPCFKGVATLSAYQERTLHEKNGVDWCCMARTGNGVDTRLFEGLDFTAKNKRLLHSSCFYRSGKIMKDEIAMRLGLLMDGGVDFCSYADSPKEYDNVYSKYIGSFNKSDLYRQMAERYCWFYPLTMDETFCITMIENVMCENDIILPMNYGNTSVLEPFVNDVTMKHNFLGDKTEFDLAVNEAIDRIIKSVENHEEGEGLRMELKDYVLSNHTWDNVVDRWLKLN